MSVHDRMLWNMRNAMKPMYSGEAIVAPVYVYPEQLENECRENIREVLSKLNRKQMISGELEVSFMDVAIESRFSIIKNRIFLQTIQHKSFINELKRNITHEIKRLGKLVIAIDEFHQEMMNYSEQLQFRDKKSLLSNLVTSIRRNRIDRKVRKILIVREETGCSIVEMRKLYESVEGIEEQEAVELRKMLDFINEKQEEMRQDVRNLIESIIQHRRNKEKDGLNDDNEIMNAES